MKYNKVTSSNKQSLGWDSDCQTAEVNKYFLLRKFRRTNSAIDLHNYGSAKARFKNVCRSKRLHFEKGK